MNERTKIARSIRLLRLYNGYTQKQVSSWIHISRSAYCQYELGKRTPDTSTLLSICTLYAIPIESLLYGPHIPRSSNPEETLHSRRKRLYQMYNRLCYRDQLKVEALIYTLHMCEERDLSMDK